MSMIHADPCHLGCNDILEEVDDVDATETSIHVFV